MTASFATLLSGWAGCLAAGFLLWLWSLRRRDASVVDIWWGLFFVGLTVWFRWRGPESTPLHHFHLLLVALWGVRLALHIALRGRGQGEDRRYAAMRAAHGARFGWVSLFTVFGLQATLATLLAMPLLAVQAARHIDAAEFVAGTLLWTFGLFWEAVGDWQLARFQHEPASSGRVLDRGLWRYTRHPNYFGEAVIWWGYGLMAGATGAWWALFASLLMTWLLLRVSGVALLEKTIAGRRPEYADYIQRTSPFIPLPPR